MRQDSSNLLSSAHAASAILWCASSPCQSAAMIKEGRRRGIQPSRSARTAEHSVNARAGDRLRLCMRRRLGFNRGGNGNAVLLGLLQLFAGDLKPHRCLTEIFNSYRIGEAVMSMMEPCGRSLSKLWSASRAAWSMLSFIAAACSWCSSSSLVGLRIRVSTPGPPPLSVSMCIVYDIHITRIKLMYVCSIHTLRPAMEACGRREKIRVKL